ncbi:response regulator [Egicoccus halophilus]|uniref:DNA-binding response regulator n=1 Tax=Egicoccus halophilus TaxID=1670830 RepID=A0A8J3ACE0_9ACTN|nr:response regulator transcription factor [Egicoccus halophilus]GGI03560.1 DNA-binding response regulator [Egicoccus halophilus]
MTIRVLIADDHQLFLDGLRLLLDTTPDLEVVGAVGDGAALLEAAERTDFDVAVVDLDMPGLDGATATRRLLASQPTAAVLILTMHDDEASLVQALRAGARGYVLKGAGQGSLVRAITAVHEGDTVLTGAAGRAVLAAVRAESPPFPGCTPRETQVLDLVARGLDNDEIARRLSLSRKTVQNHVSALLTKLQVNSRARLVVRARDAGLGASRS